VPLPVGRWWRWDLWRLVPGGTRRSPWVPAQRVGRPRSGGWRTAGRTGDTSTAIFIALYATVPGRRSPVLLTVWGRTTVRAGAVALVATVVCSDVRRSTNAGVSLGPHGNHLRPPEWAPERQPKKSWRGSPDRCWPASGRGDLPAGVIHARRAWLGGGVRGWPLAVTATLGKSASR